MAKKHDLLPLLGRLILGGLLLWAGVLKIGSPFDFAGKIANYQQIPDNLTFLAGLCLPWLEVVIGLCLVLGLLSNAAALLGGLLSGLFAYAVGRAVASGRTVDCGCFAGDSTASWGHVGLDLALVLVALLLVHFGPGRWSLDARWGWLDPRPGKRELVLASLGALLFLVNVSYLALHAGSSPAMPKGKGPGCPIVFSSPVVDFGKMTQAQTKTAEVEFTNISGSKIHIERIDSNCGCTTSQPSTRILAPGERARLTVAFDSGTKQGPSETNVVIHVKGSTEPAILRVGADVQPLLEFVPGLLQLKAGESARVRLERRQPDLKFSVTRITPPTEQLSARIVSTSAEAVEIEVAAKGQLPAPASPQTAWRVHVFTDVPNLPPLSLYVKGEP